MPAIRIANAPCSWGTLEFEGLTGETVGYEKMLDELAETGYAGTELGDWGYMPTDPKGLHHQLSQRNLVLVGAFVPVALADERSHEGGLGKALQAARLLAAVADIGDYDPLPWLVLADDNGTDPLRTKSAGRLDGASGMTESQWVSFARGAEAIAEAVTLQTKLSTVFHHHCGGYVETPTETARLLERTDPALVGLVLDTGHFMYGSGTNDPAPLLEFMERFAHRIAHVHFKDCHPDVARSARSGGWDYFEAVRQGVFCELGQGCVDFPAVIDWLQRRDYDGWAVVEQDVLPGLGSPRQSAQRSRDYLRSLGV